MSFSMDQDAGDSDEDPLDGNVTGGFITNHNPLEMLQVGGWIWAFVRAAAV